MKNGTPQVAPSPQAPHHAVFIHTIGGIQAMVHGAAAIWHVGKMGIPQLKRMLSYMVARVDQAIHRDDLAEIGRRQLRALRATTMALNGAAVTVSEAATGPSTLARAANLPGAIKHLIRNWHMGDAIREQDGYLTLTRHDCWMSDTDIIERYASSAAIHLDAGHTDAAVADLYQAAAYCGGPYLPTYDVPDYSLQDEQQHWLHYQRDVLHQLARLLSDRAAYQEALLVAKKTTRLGDDDPADAALLADIYAALGNDSSAAYYRRKSQRL